MKLPIGIQTFSEIRDRNLLYIDKTKQIHGILTSGKYFFLSRPRRFGKSLLLSTMHSLYEGRKDLFEGLWIADKWNWEKTYPVIHIQFASQGYRTIGLEKAVFQMIEQVAKFLNISLESEGFSSRFKELIQKAAENSPSKKAVVLIDEYDKPIIDYLDDIPQATENRKILKSFYSVLKDSDPYLELVFITGVSRFAKTSIFSDLNNLQNLTLDETAVDLLGITYQEVEQYFTERLHFLAQKKKTTFDDLHEQMRYWYNGYSWDGALKVYNPFSLLSFMKAGQFQNYWFETGTPTFLINLMVNRKVFQIENLRVPDTTLSSYDIEYLQTPTLLFQTGYLTILRTYPMGVYELTYPNKEVKMSLEEHLLNKYTNDTSGKGRVHALQIAEYFKTEEIEQVIKTINGVFATIPYQLWQKDNETFYHALIHLTFSLVGVFIQSEINSSNGRLDAMIETVDAIYIIEFKLDKSADLALQQIQTKNYFAPYQSSLKKKVGIGINFSKELKAVEHYKLKEF